MAAAIPAIQAVFAWLGTGTFAAVMTRTILINVALGALEFEDDGETWVAVNEG